MHSSCLVCFKDISKITFYHCSLVTFTNFKKNPVAVVQDGWIHDYLIAARCVVNADWQILYSHPVAEIFILLRALQSSASVSSQALLLAEFILDSFSHRAAAFALTFECIMGLGE